MKDKLNYGNGRTWKYLKGSWYDCRVTKASRCWKDQSKRRRQYRPVTISE